MKNLMHIAIALLFMFFSQTIFSMTWFTNGKNTEEQNAWSNILETQSLIAQQLEDHKKTLVSFDESFTKSLNSINESLRALAIGFDEMNKKISTGTPWQQLQQEFKEKRNWLHKNFIWIKDWIKDWSKAHRCELILGTTVTLTLCLSASILWGVYFTELELKKYQWSIWKPKGQEVVIDDLLTALYKKYARVGYRDEQSHVLVHFMEDIAQEQRLLELYYTKAKYLFYTPYRWIVNWQLFEDIPNRLNYLHTLQDLVRSWFAQQALKNRGF